MSILSSASDIDNFVEPVAASPEPAATPDDFLNIAEAAKLIGQHRQALWRSVQRGHIETVTVNGKTRLRLADIRFYDRRWRKIKRGRPRGAASKPKVPLLLS